MERGEMTTTPVIEAIDETATRQGGPPQNVVYEWLTTVDHKKIGQIGRAHV